MEMLNLIIDANRTLKQYQNTSLANILEKQAEFMNNHPNQQFKEYVALNNIIFVIPKTRLSERNYRNIYATYPNVKDYTFIMDKLVNPQMIEREVDYLTDALIKDMILAIEACPVPRETQYLYRGFSSEEEFVKGQIVEEKGFLSKTIDFDVATSYSKREQNKILLFLNRNKSLYLEGISHFPEEQEVLTLPNDKYVVRDIFKYYDGTEMYTIYAVENVGPPVIIPYVINNQRISRYQEFKSYVNTLSKEYLIIFDVDVPGIVKVSYFRGKNKNKFSGSLLESAFDQEDNLDYIKIRNIMIHYGLAKGNRLCIITNNDKQEKLEQAIQLYRRLSIPFQKVYDGFKNNHQQYNVFE